MTPTPGETATGSGVAPPTMVATTMVVPMATGTTMTSSVVGSVWTSTSIITITITIPLGVIVGVVIIVVGGDPVVVILREIV